MNTKRFAIISLLVIAALVLGVVGDFAWFATAGMRSPLRVAAPDYWPTDGWRTSSPEEQGFDSAKLAQAVQSLHEKQVNIDSLLIVRNGYVVLDARFDPYDGTFPHDLASVTKSVTTTLIGIAAEQGKLGLDQRMLSFFPDRTIANLDERKARITVRHLVSMVNGMQSGCYEGDEPTIDAMRAHTDWVQAALDRPMVSEPGTTFCYDSPGMHILSAILQKATGMTALDFARQYLFEPLGIQEVIWESDPQGYTRGWGDLHLLPADLAKIGFLWLHRGNWDGRKIVPEAWVLDSVKAHSKYIEPDFGYGYGWWITDKDYQASGRGGQRVRVMASLNLIVAATGADFDYAEVESWLIPMLLQLHVRNSLPSNPQGQAALDAVVKSVRPVPAGWISAFTPGTAARISGKRYLCKDNPARIESVRAEFADPKQATLFLEMNGTQMVLPVGLNGGYRLSPQGVGSRGYWTDARTFQFEICNIGLERRRLVFDGNRLEITLPEAELTVDCQTLDP